MTYPIPSGSLLGELRITEVFLSFDGPRFFACANEIDEHYLGLFVDEDDESETFIFAATSLSSLRSLRRGSVAIREMFANPGRGGVLKARFSEGEEEHTWIAAGLVPDEWLPYADQRLESSDDGLGNELESELFEESREQGRTLVAIEFETDHPTTEYSARAVGEVVSAYQGLTEAFGQASVGRATDRGAIQRDVLQATELNFYGARAASFAIVLAAPRSDQLFEPETVSDASNMILDLMTASNDGSESFLRALSSMNSRSVKRYVRLLEDLASSNTDVSAILAAPYSDLRTVRMPRSSIRESLLASRQISEPEVRVVELESVRLVGVNARRMTFEIYDSATEQKYTGYIVSAARTRVSGLRIDDIYDVVLERIDTRDEATGAIRTRYRMLFIDPAQLVLESD